LFPQNIYFGYDQSRDATVSQEIYKNHDLKIIGPSAGKDGLFHGPLYWYLIGPLYLFSRGNPAYVLGFISLINAAGVFLIYFLAKKIFGEKVGLCSALLYAFSFSESQYALYFANPAPAVLSMMIFYLGWAILIFQKKPLAWILVGLGLGLSIQFEFFLIYLFSSAIILPLVFWPEVKQGLKPKYLFLGFLSLFLTMFSFILAEVKYGFRTTRTLLSVFLPKTEVGIKLPTSSFLGRLGMEIYYDVFNFWPSLREISAFALILTIVFLAIKVKTLRKAFIFILIWIVSNYFLDFFGPPQLYYVGIGLAIPVIFLLAYFLTILWQKQKFFSLALLVLFIFANLNLMKKYNPMGPVMDLYVQKGMLLRDEVKVIDKIYKEANGKKFTVNALTMPYKIKTTWAYLFNWYGRQKYGYVPFWGGEDVPGYAGVMPHPDSSKYVRFAIYEPMRGIPEELKKEFIDSENGYAMPTNNEEIGYFVWEKRTP
ncbi:MAG: glycosyltransferase family 39 protein, partial [Patescibacteria group bacterium]|nr:glycosyltransferase family 39 protein [Patescibacteria group bacterium]